MSKKSSQSNEKVDFIYSMRHSCAHLLAAAVQKLYPNAKFGVGPVVENGFYYDIDFGDSPISVDDFPKIEGEMEMLRRQNLGFERQELPIAEAIEWFTKANQPFKVELLNDIKKHGTTVFKEIENAKEEIEQEIIGTVSLYKTGEFVDLCRGPHVKDTSEIGHYKLMSVAGAYWRGSEKNQMLTRIYGVAFESKVELENYVTMMEEAKKRDHRKLGKELDLFTFSDVVGKGLPLWTPKGSVVRRELERFIIDEEIKRGYLHVYTPDVAKLDLYRKSGHYPYYKDSMYAPIVIDDEEFMLRPMTCPHHFELYLSKPRSYRELPMRIAELAKLYRYEQSGELTGLIRVRGFCLADAHIVCTGKEQAIEEVGKALDLIEYIAGTFGLSLGKDYWYRLSLGDRKNEEKYYKNDSAWDQAEAALREHLVSRGSKFIEAAGEAAFYGPKIDIQMRNVMGKEDTAFTVQYDFCMPDRFELDYADAHGTKQRAVVVHRSSIGAIERIVAFLIEHFAGAFPVWLSPVQVVLATVADGFNEFANQLAGEFRSQGIRVEVDDANETVGNKIRKASAQKIPYTLVIGEKEASGEPFMIRERGVEKQYSLSKEDFVEKVKKQIVERSIS